MSENKKTAVVVIPTYNEADSIGEMITHLFTEIFPKIDNYDMKLLVVDDTSPDGTYKIVKSFQNKYPDLHLYLNPQKAGIGMAYVKGFEYAMKKLHADVVFEFDGDFQHPPADIPKMLVEIDKGADVVMGSRKIKGGSNPKGWGFNRVFLSEIGGLTARFILFFPTKTFSKITDPTTGFRATRVKGFLDQIDFKVWHSYQFSYKLQMIHQLVSLGAKFKEIPLKFGLRMKGESKITSQTAKDSLRTAILTRLYDPSTKKFIKFGTVGFIGFAVNSLTLEFFRRISISTDLADNFNYLASTPFALLSTPSAWAGGLAAECAIISNFLLNNFWTFAAEKIMNPLRFLLKFIQFNLTSLGAVVIQFVVIGLATRIFGDTALVRQIFLILSIGFLILPYNWIMYNTFIWKGKKK